LTDKGKDDDQGWFRRNKKRSPPSSWPFGDIDDMMKEMERDFAENFKEIEKMAPKNLLREKKLPDGTVKKEIGPIVYGYSITVGPDGKPEIREFGNVKRGTGPPWQQIEDKREPLVDVVTTDKDVKVIAEMPGVRKEDIKVEVREKNVTISVDTESRKYYKQMDLPELVQPEVARSTFINGVLEISLPRKTTGSAGVKLRID
jgi:HSP20 family protein